MNRIQYFSCFLTVTVVADPVSLQVSTHGTAETELDESQVKAVMAVGL